MYQWSKEHGSLALKIITQKSNQYIVEQWSKSQKCNQLFNQNTSIHGNE